MNDQLGDCVVAATANTTRNFENFEQGKDPTITDEDVKVQYFKETDGPDTGLVELDHLNTWRKDGFLVGDKVYKIHAFASVDWKNHTEVKYCIYLLNGIFLGLALPITAQSQLSSGIWTIVNPGSPDAVPGSWGYHAVIGQAFTPDSPVPPTPPTPPKPGCLPGARILSLFKKKPRIVGYSATGPILLTWGMRVQADWDWLDECCDEAYGVIDERDTWMDPAIDPIDVAKLDQLLLEITKVGGIR